MYLVKGEYSMSILETINNEQRNSLEQIISRLLKEEPQSILNCDTHPKTIGINASDDEKVKALEILKSLSKEELLKMFISSNLK